MANVTAAETLGDELLKGCEHTTRHNRVVGAWVRAVGRAGGARRGAHARDRRGAGVEPDFVSEYAGRAPGGRGQGLQHQQTQPSCFVVRLLTSPVLHCQTTMNEPNTRTQTQPNRIARMKFVRSERWPS